jgi:hypothetical protein
MRIVVLNIRITSQVAVSTFYLEKNKMTQPYEEYIVGKILFTQRYNTFKPLDSYIHFMQLNHEHIFIFAFL